MNITDRLKLIILEKSNKEIIRIKSLLKKTDFNFQIKVLKDNSTYNEAVNKFSPDIVIADFFVNDLTAIDAISIAKKKDAAIIFIIFTDPVDESSAVKCLKNGAWDYILKNKSEKLIPSILKIPSELCSIKDLYRSSLFRIVSEEYLLSNS